jgi:L-threonylcarbamoyladenylate synthase
MRPGGISREELAAALGAAPRDRDAHAPRASGTLAAHYAPRTPLALVEPAALAAQVSRPDIAVLALRPAPGDARIERWITAPFDAVRYGHDLYANLRALDASGARRIVVEAPPRTPPWEAVNDRLTRAAAHTAALDDQP